LEFSEGLEGEKEGDKHTQGEPTHQQVGNACRLASMGYKMKEFWVQLLKLKLKLGSYNFCFRLNFCWSLESGAVARANLLYSSW